ASLVPLRHAASSELYALSLHDALPISFGIDRGLPFPVADLDQAGQVMLLGSNVADTMPPFVQHLERARDRGGLIVVDPRRSATRSEEHTSELQSREKLVCRLLPEKKND